jgi:hypothetical protein
MVLLFGIIIRMKTKLTAHLSILALLMLAGLLPVSADTVVRRPVYTQTPGTSFVTECGPATFLHFGGLFDNLATNTFYYSFTAVGGGTVSASVGTTTNSVSVPYDQTPRTYTFTVSRYTFNEFVQFTFGADRTCSGGQLTITNLVIEKDFVTVRTKANY